MYIYICIYIYVYIYINIYIYICDFSQMDIDHFNGWYTSVFREDHFNINHDWYIKWSTTMSIKTIIVIIRLDCIWLVVISMRHFWTSLLSENQWDLVKSGEPTTKLGLQLELHPSVPGTGRCGAGPGGFPVVHYRNTVNVKLGFMKHQFINGQFISLRKTEPFFYAQGRGLTSIFMWHIQFLHLWLWSL